MAPPFDDKNTYNWSGGTKAVVWAPAVVMVCLLAPVRGSMDWTSPGLPCGSMGVISDARRDRQLLLVDHCGAVRLGSYFERALRFQAACVDPSHAGGSAVGHQDHPALRDDTGSFRKVGQGRDVLAGL